MRELTLFLSFIFIVWILHVVRKQKKRFSHDSLSFSLGLFLSSSGSLSDLESPCDPDRGRINLLRGPPGWPGSPRLAGARPVGRGPPGAVGRAADDGLG